MRKHPTPYQRQRLLREIQDDMNDESFFERHFKTIFVTGFIFTILFWGVVLWGIIELILWLRSN